MASQTALRLSEEEYLSLERENPYRSEYIEGEMLAMAGGSLRHSALATKCSSVLDNKVSELGCTVFSSDAKVRTALSGSYVYPDVPVVCGEVRMHENTTDVLLNPVLVVEVLSASTHSYDAGRKFDLYREVPSLQEYLLVHQDSPKVGHYSRRPDDSWIFREIAGMEQSVDIPALAISLDLASLYKAALQIPI